MSKQSKSLTDDTTAIAGTTAFSGATSYVTSAYSVPSENSYVVGQTLRHDAQDRDIESAVYSHIQAVRALGVTRIDSLQIARALGISRRIVEKTIPSLSDKGVKVING